MPVRQLLVSAFALLSLAACAGEEERSAIPDGDPRDGRRQELRGFIYKPDAMATEDGVIAWAQQAISGYARVDGDTPPANVGDPPGPSCRFPAPAADDLVRHVIVERGAQETPIYQFTRKEVGERAATFVKYYSASGGKSDNAQNYEPDDVMRLVNVAITETSAPVYLVLSSETNVLWNILPASGATISNIAMISSGDAGLVNAPDGTKISVLPGASLKRCSAPKPMRRPQDDWGFVRNMREAGSSLGGEALAKNKRAASDYARWLKKNFGGSVMVDNVAQQGVANALIGPLPVRSEGRAPYRPIEAVLLSNADYRLIAAKRDYRKAHDAVILEAARKAAGGDLEALAKATRR